MSHTQDRIDINTATLEELKQIPGIGPAMAEGIAAARPFSSFAELRRVSGIGEATLERLRPYITISETEPAAEIPAMSEADDAFEYSLDKIEQPQEPFEDGLALQAPAPAPEPHAAPEQEAQRREVEPAQALSAGESKAAIEALEQPGEDAPPVIAATGEAQKAASEVPPRPAAQKAPHSLHAARKRPEGYTRAQTLWLTVGASLLTLMISFIAVLGILLILNGSLRYVKPGEFTTLKRQADGLEAQAIILEQELEGLRDRLENLEALSGRLSTLEREYKKMRDEVSSTARKIADVERQVGEMDAQIEELRANSSRFQSFLDGLRSLLGELMAP